MYKLICKIAVVTLISLSSLPVFSAAGSAIAIVSGDVAVNGNSIKRTMPVFEGDRLTTGASSGVLLHLKGATVQLSPNSEVRYEGEKLALTSGIALVRGSEIVASGPFLIAAVGDGHFRIERSGSLTKLSILTGKVKVIRGKNSLILSGTGERQFSDEDTIAAVRHTSITSEVAAGAAGGASGAAVTGWMKHGSKQASISRKSPTEP
jgi:hypothetical protein